MIVIKYLIFWNSNYFLFIKFIYSDSSYTIEDNELDIDEIYSLTGCLRVNEIWHTILLMEYLPTSSEGIAK